MEELPGYFRRDSDISEFVANYVYESHSIFGFTFLDGSAQVFVEDNRGNLFHSFFTDIFDNCYLLSGTDASLYFYGSDWEPDELIPMANRFGNFLQIADCYAWEKFPTLSEREFEKICEYVGTYGNNPYWGSLRSHGTVKTVQSLRQKL